MYETGTEVFKNYKKFALLGASADHARFGYEVFEAFHINNIPLMPINPKYLDIDGQACFPSLAALPERPEVVIVDSGHAFCVVRGDRIGSPGDLDAARLF